MKYLLLFASLVIVCCVQEEDLQYPEVSYTFLVSDSITQLGLDSVSITIKNEELAKVTLTTDSEGRADSEIIQSRLNQILITRPGYLSKDSIDQIILGQDSSLTLQFKTIAVSLLKVSDRDSLQNINSIQ